jgi:hypothetical protein
MPACRLEALETTSRDCEQLMPQAMADLTGRLEALSAELGAAERELVEAEAQHELYKLLETRTRWATVCVSLSTAAARAC